MEYLLKLQGPSDLDLHSVVVYKAGYSLDDNGDPDRMVSLWVVARGYEGGGIIGNHSCICRYDDDFEESMIRSQSAFPDLEDFADNQNPEFEPSVDDIEELKKLWEELNRISCLDDDSNEFKSLLPVPDNQDAVHSEGWDADDLLESVSEGWQLFLKF
jgi:hypothetical protein